VSKPLTITAAAIAALVVGATGFASSLAPPNEARALGELFFNRNMARAEVVIVKGGVVHDYRLDQGKVLSVRLSGERVNGLYPDTGTVLDSATIRIRIPDTTPDTQVVQFVDAVLPTANTPVITELYVLLPWFVTDVAGARSTYSSFETVLTSGWTSTSKAPPI